MKTVLLENISKAWKMLNLENFLTVLIILIVGWRVYRLIKTFLLKRQVISGIHNRITKVRRKFRQFLVKRIGLFKNVISGMMLLAILIAPFVYVAVSWPERTFWDSAVGNMIATILALIAGIPIALWIDRRIKLSEENRKYAIERKRERELLKKIKNELEYSYRDLFLRESKGNISSINIRPYKTDFWDALTASNELKYIEDIGLLDNITNAYYVLKFVRGIENEAYKALRTSAISFTGRDGTKKNAAQMLLEDARSHDNLMDAALPMAIKHTESRIRKLGKL